MKYTNFKVINTRAGGYSGWSIAATAKIKEDWYDNNPQEEFNIIELDAGYTYQTESMIYRFSLKVGLNESQ